MNGFTNCCHLAPVVIKILKVWQEAQSLLKKAPLVCEELTEGSGSELLSILWHWKQEVGFDPLAFE